MFRYTSLALLTSALLILGHRSDAAAPCQPPAITTAVAYESWVAWYHIHPDAAADTAGPRFKQLLAAADGDLYFLKGLDDSSPQVCELSVYGLVRAPTIRSYLQIVERLASPDERICRQAQAVLVMHPLRNRFGDELADRDDGSTVAADGTTPRVLPDSRQSWQTFARGVAFGGLMRIALTGCKTGHADSTAWLDSVIDPEVLRLTKAVSDLEPGGRYVYAEEAEQLKQLKQFLAQAERRQASKNAAQKLLELLDHSAQSSPLDEMSVDLIKQALARHAEPSTTTTNQDYPAAAAESKMPWPAYRAQVMLERLSEVAQFTGNNFLQPGTNRYEPANSPCQPATEPFGWQLSNGDTCRYHFDPRSAAGPVESDRVPATWISSSVGELQSLAPGIYKLLLTFDAAADVPFGFDGRQMWPQRVGAIVFRVNCDATSPVTGIGQPTEPAAWQVVQVALSDSTLDWDDLCIPAPPTFAQRTITPPRAMRQQLINFVGTMGR